MARIIVCILFIWMKFLLFSQTYYYKQVTKITNGVKHAGNNTGQFITFTDKGCYDSDLDGYTVQNGFLKYNKTENEILYYIGNSYWGTQCQYCFNISKDRLNIIPDNSDVIFVYQRISTPANAKTCYYIKSLNSPLPSRAYINFRQSGSSTSSDKKTQSTMTCPYCKGTGKVEKNIDIATYGTPTTYHTCDYCGKRISSGTAHCHVMCLECHGTGLIKMN